MRYKIGIGWEHSLDRGNTKIELTPYVALINTALNKGIEFGWFGCHLFLGVLDLDTLRELQEAEAADLQQEEHPREP